MAVSRGKLMVQKALQKTLQDDVQKNEKESVKCDSNLVRRGTRKRCLSRRLQFEEVNFLILLLLYEAVTHVYFQSDAYTV